MIRDPFSAMIAEQNRLHGGPVGHADQSTFVQNNGSAWAKYVYQYINEWAYFNIDWYDSFAKNNSIYVVEYESLERNTEHEMKRILNFLNINLSKSSFNCAMFRKEGLYHRQKQQSPVKHFDDDMIRNINWVKYKVYLALHLTLLSVHDVRVTEP